jgi:hypothetical protein
MGVLSEVQQGLVPRTLRHFPEIFLAVDTKLPATKAVVTHHVDTGDAPPVYEHWCDHHDQDALIRKEIINMHRGVCPILRIGEALDQLGSAR